MSIVCSIIDSIASHANREIWNAIILLAFFNWTGSVCGKCHRKSHHNPDHIFHPTLNDGKLFGRKTLKSNLRKRKIFDDIWHNMLLVSIYTTFKFYFLANTRRKTTNKNIIKFMMFFSNICTKICMMWGNLCFMFHFFICIVIFKFFNYCERKENFNSN
jgi:hypothetical protein